MVSFVDAIEGYFHRNGQPDLKLTNDCARGHQGTDDTHFCTTFLGYVGDKLSYSLGPANSYQVLMTRTISPRGVSWKVQDSHASSNRVGGPAPWDSRVVTYTMKTHGPASGTPLGAIGKWGELHGLKVSLACETNGVLCAQYLGGPDGTGNYTLMIRTGSDGSAVLVEDVTVMNVSAGAAVVSAQPLGDYPQGAGSDH